MERLAGLLTLAFAVATLPCSGASRWTDKQLNSRSWKCPGSGATLMHASVRVAVEFNENSCDQVRTEMLARVNGQYGNWHDPHDNGTYEVLSSKAKTEALARELSLPETKGEGSEDLLLKRTTPVKKYVDKMLFTFVESGNSSGSCKLYGCSESQITSFLDYGTNYCNLKMMYCTEGDGCKHVKVSINSDSVNEIKIVNSPGAKVDLDTCLTV